VTVSITPSHLDAVSMSPTPYQFRATVTGSSDSEVTWSIEENPLGSTRDGTIDSTGLYTPPQNQSVSFVCHVVATSRADPTQSALAVVNVWGDVIDHGGPVVPASRTFVVWWGDPSSFASDDRSEMEAFLNGLSDSTYLAIADQYLRGAKASTTFGGTFVDTRTPPAGNPPVDTVNNTACGALQTNGIHAADGDIIVVSSASQTTSYCGWHGWMTCQGHNVLIAYLPAEGVSGFCSYGQPDCGTGHSPESMSLVSGAAHELIEAMTDPEGTAWYASGEVADKCGALVCVSMPTGTFSVGTLYSNEKHGCASQ
jgi:hypothetical protein